MRLIEAYDKAIAINHYKDSPMQRQIICELEHIASVLQKKSWCFFRRKNPIKGLYLYGQVGVGKTFIMDLFYNYLKTNKKKRQHFHYFMQHIHQALKARQGQKNPLDKIAKDFARHHQILCLDEFIVYDIADAMILANLLDALFQEGVVLMTTSNTEPDNLYLKGLQRQRFLPAIDLLKAHCQVMEMTSVGDYRLTKASQDKAYWYPINDTTAAELKAQFKRLAPIAKTSGMIQIQKRDIHFLACSEQVIWFEFEKLCEIPRSQQDYLEIASRFHTVFLSHIPVFMPNDTTKVRLFMLFIDVMYDEEIRVFMSAEKAIDELYLKGPLYHEFQRTKSRLHEMQSLAHSNKHSN